MCRRWGDECSLLQVPTDLEAREDGFHQRKIAREVMVLK